MWQGEIVNIAVQECVRPGNEIDEKENERLV